MNKQTRAEREKTRARKEVTLKVANVENGRKEEEEEEDRKMKQFKLSVSISHVVYVVYTHIRTIHPRT